MAEDRQVATYSIMVATYQRIKDLADATRRNPGVVIDLAIAGMTPAKLNRIAHMLSEQDTEPEQVTA